MIAEPPHFALKSPTMSIELPRTIASEASQRMNDVIFLIPNWKWIAAVIALFTGFILRSLSKQLIFQIKSRYGQHHKLPAAISYWLAKDVQYPLSWLLAAGVWHFGLQIISIHEGIEHVLVLVIHLLVLVNLMRLAYFGAEGTGLAMEDWVKASGGSLDGQLAPFATKVLKIVVVTLGFLLSMQSLGFNVGAILAGLGIGSLALALAAQDTAANLFGSITIILDRPFQRGDYVKVGDTEGTVEEVGFRSTQIRTAYKSMITVPNSIMAKERIDNLGARPARRLRHVIGVASSTPPALVQQFIEEIRRKLDLHPLILKDETYVYVQSLGDFDIKISMTCFVNTSDFRLECQTQQELLLEIIHLAGTMEIHLPYPTHTLHLASLPHQVNSTGI